MSIIRDDKIYQYLKANLSTVWFRYSIDDNGAYQFVFQTGTSGADQAAVVAQAAFQNVLNYPGATTTTGNVIDPAILANVTFPDGSAAAPSITFTNELTTGFYRSGAGQIGVAILGTNSLVIGAGGSITTLPSNGGYTFTTNGTGAIKFAFPSTQIFFRPDSTPTFASLHLGIVTPSTSNYALQSNGNYVTLNAPLSNQHIRFAQGDTERARLAATTGDLLIGGLTTDGVGVLQLPAATTSAGGISFGTDTFLFRSAVNALSVNVSGNTYWTYEAAGNLGFLLGSAAKFYNPANNGSSLIVNTAGSGSANLVFSTAGVVALTLDTSQAVISAKGQAWGVTSTATATGTTVLTSTSTSVQIFTGATTQAVTLPAANLRAAGAAVLFVIKNRSSGTVTINRAGADTIDGATSYALLAGNSITLLSDGVSDWTVN